MNPQSTVGSRAFTSISRPARILACGPAAIGLRATLEASLSGHICWEVADTAHAAESLSRERAHDVALLDWSQGEERIGQLCAALRAANDATSIILVGGAQSVAALQLAVQLGAHSVASVHSEEQVLSEQVGSALDKALADRLRREKLSLLESLCDRLAQDRDELSRRLGGVCGDLANAWEQFEERSSVMSRVGEFRALLSQELETDDVIRTAMQYLLRVVGPTNIAVFTQFGGSWKLAGYAKEDTPRTSATDMLRKLRDDWCASLAASAGVVCNENPGLLACVEQRSVLAMCGRHGGQPEVIAVCFRSADRPFGKPEIAAVDALRDVFADAVERTGRILQRAQPSWPKGTPGSVDQD